MTEPISRRKALGLTGTLLAAAACRPDSLFSPSEPNLFSAAELPITLIGAGDSHVRGPHHLSHKTGALIRQALESNPNAYALALGDVAGNSSLDWEFKRYDLAWGSFRERTLVVLGNHEKNVDPSASAYFDYFGANAGERGRGWYARTLGAWRCYFLNCYWFREEQTAWLAEDLPRHPRLHKAAFLHVPTFASDCAHDGGTNMARAKPQRRWWTLLQRYGCELIVAGHIHRYERFAPVLWDGTRSPMGIRQFIAGTGGGTLMKLGPRHSSSESQYAGFGVFQLTLHPGRYEWRFTDVSGTVRDEGRTNCRALAA